MAAAAFRDIPFEAALVSERRDLAQMLDMPGVDGFVFNVDPLYKVTIFTED